MVAIINKVNKVSSRTKIITLLKTCVWIEIRGSEIIVLQYPFHSNIRTSYRFLPLVACCALISHIVPYLSFPMLYRILRPHLRKIIKYVPALWIILSTELFCCTHILFVCASTFLLFASNAFIYCILNSVFGYQLLGTNCLAAKAHSMCKALVENVGYRRVQLIRFPHEWVWPFLLSSVLFSRDFYRLFYDTQRGWLREGCQADHLLVHIIPSECFAAASRNFASLIW